MMKMSTKIDKHLISEAKRTKSYGRKDIQNIADEAEMAFWGTVSDMVPEADTGDLDPATSQKLQSMMQMAIKKWIELNT